MKKIKGILIIALFAVIICGFGIWHAAASDAEISVSERRRLAKLPELTSKTVFSAEYMQDLEEYLLDQFPLRDTFRGIKTTVSRKLFGMQDTNGLYEYQDAIFKIEYPTDEKQIAYARDKFSEIYELYLSGTDVKAYYAIIPDKNYYIREESGRPMLDYDKLVEIMSGVSGMEYIDLFDVLSVGDYYATDTHWRQEKLQPVVQKLAEGMDIVEYLPDWDTYTAQSLTPFKGVYLGQSAMNVPADTLTYLESNGTRMAAVTSVESGAIPVYTIDRFTGTDGYDVYLGGAQALLTIENPMSETDRELIVFRDSFGSSIAPLFVDTYRKITLVDLRYFSSKLLNDYVEFRDQDVLFLYSTSLLNSGRLLK
ncbi:MAG: hypothetical protein IKK29_07110 [Christensenellaceae bacterium]|nr:hypothetical protein [Christensenellaceae bacterium]